MTTTAYTARFCNAVKLTFAEKKHFLTSNKYPVNFKIIKFFTLDKSVFFTIKRRDVFLGAT